MQEYLTLLTSMLIVGIEAANIFKKLQSTIPNYGDIYSTISINYTATIPKNTKQASTYIMTLIMTDTCILQCTLANCNILCTAPQNILNKKVVLSNVGSYTTCHITTNPLQTLLAISF